MKKVEIGIIPYATKSTGEWPMRRKCGTGYGSRGHMTFLNKELVVADYNEFPAIQFYQNKYGVFPSTTGYDCQYNYRDFMERIKAIRKNGFYCESVNQYSNHKEKENGLHRFKDFIFCEDVKRKLCFYITISWGQLFGLDGIMKVSIVTLFNPELDADDILELVMNKIIGLPEIPRVETEAVGLLNILVKTPKGFELEPMRITQPDIDFAINYNADFDTVHKLIVEKLSVDNSKGLILLHGKPGTGKTTYIRYLINVLKKRIIYIPPNMTSVISDPELIKFFMQHSNSILVIEDAESVLITRAAGSSQAIANILNLTDGLLSDCTNIQVVATFNTELSAIDKALLRKGRLIAKYEFKELEESRSKLLAEKLGVQIHDKHTLADIYNADELSFSEPRRKLGFN